MSKIPLSDSELSSIRTGEAITLATVMVVFTVVILTVIAWKLFVSKGAKVTLPNGYHFEWTSASA